MQDQPHLTFGGIQVLAIEIFTRLSERRTVALVAFDALETALRAVIVGIDRKRTSEQLCGRIELHGAARRIGLRNQFLHGRLASRLEIQAERHVMRIFRHGLRKI